MTSVFTVPTRVSPWLAPNIARSFILRIDTAALIDVLHSGITTSTKNASQPFSLSLTLSHSVDSHESGCGL